MLTSPERVRPEDKPLADLALRTAEKCKAAVATAWALLPPPAHARVLSVARQADALNSQLYTGKITFGEYNVKRIQILKQMAHRQATVQPATLLAAHRPIPAPARRSEVLH
jgi:hypothetical protein